jgi:hypothetical protein
VLAEREATERWLFYWLMIRNESKTAIASKLAPTEKQKQPAGASRFSLLTTQHDER